MSDDYDAELARLKRSAARHKAGQNQRPRLNLVCCVCSATPAPMTRFGPRCEAHRPGPEPAP